MKRILIIGLLALGGCTKAPSSGWPGYGEGDYAMISAPQAGWITSLAVERGARVHKGQLLFTLDETAQAASREQATASLAQARALLATEQANLKYLRIELARQNGLARESAGTGATRDQAESNVRQSEQRIAQDTANIKQIEASLHGADYTLTQRKVYALTEGPVEDIYFRPGEYVAPATAVVSILPPANSFVRFFVPETEFAKIHLGDRVRISCDGCKPTDATVTFVASREEFTPPVIFSVGSREKLVFKLEARAPGGLPIHPGQPVEVSPR